MVAENSPPMAATAKAAPINGGTGSMGSAAAVSIISISAPAIRPTTVAKASRGEKMPAGTPTG